MRKRRAVSKTLAKGFGLLVLIVLLALVLGTLVPRGGGGVSDHGEAKARRVFVLSNAIHTDLALPLDAETRALFDFVEDAGLPIFRPDARWLVLGWGGEQFYVQTPTWADMEVLPVVQSVIGDRSVMHVELTGPIDPNAAYATAIDLTDTGYADLRAAILESFVNGERGRPEALAVPGYGEFDRFYPAAGSFQVLFGCNTWTGEMLREAGVTTGFWTPLPLLLRTSLDLHN